MAKWCEGGIAEPSNTAMGYSANTDNPNSVNQQAPTFPPTSSTFQYYHYNAISGGVYTGLNAQGDKNMLLYLNMTQNHTPPIERQLVYSGNFVIPEMDGTICISRDVFWDSFLLRSNFPLLLERFNISTFAWVNWVKVERGVVSLEESAEYGLGPGYRGEHPRFYTWKNDGRSSWKWDQHLHESDDKGWAGVWDGTIEMWCWCPYQSFSECSSSFG